jgi:hypothetical protein
MQIRIRALYSTIELAICPLGIQGKEEKKKDGPSTPCN